MPDEERIQEPQEAKDRIDALLNRIELLESQLAQLMAQQGGMSDDVLSGDKSMPEQPFYQDWRLLPVGSANGQLLQWDHVDKEWKLLDGGSNDGDMLIWNNGAAEWQILEVPGAPALLAFDNTSGMRWLLIDTAYKGAYRNDSSRMVSDWLRAT